MYKSNIARLLSLLLMLMLLVGCSSNQAVYEDEPISSETSSVAVRYPKPTIHLGQGRYSFNLIINHLDGLMQTYVIKTDKKIVGEALVELGLIKMGNDDYGLHISAVDGVTLDAAKDGKSWFFVIDYNVLGAVMQTEVTAAKECFMLEPR